MTRPLTVQDDPKCGDCQQAQKHIDLSQDRRRCMEGYGIKHIMDEACMVFVDSQAEMVDAKS